MGTERLSREVKRRADVVGNSLTSRPLCRLSGCVLSEADDEWQDGDRRDLSEEPTAPLKPPEATTLDARGT